MYFRLWRITSQQNRMSSTSNLGGFTTRIRGVIGAWGKGEAQSPAAEGSFDELALELFGLQFEHNPLYREFCVARGVRPGSVAQWTSIPAVPTSAFKEQELSCLRPEGRTAMFCSSGTTGQEPSRHFHTGASLALYEASALTWFGAHFSMPCAEVASAPLTASLSALDGERVPQAGEGVNGIHAPAFRGAGASARRMLILTPPPEQAPHSSLVHMFKTLRRKLGSSDSVYVGKAAKSVPASPKSLDERKSLGSRGRSPSQARCEDGGWALDTEATRECLTDASAVNEPLLVLGTAFSLVHLLDFLAERGLRFALPPGSSAMETGGYKGRSRTMPKAALHTLVSQRLGIPADHIVCEYGMCELSSQAYDCAIPARDEAPPGPRRFRFPPWARVQIISPETGAEVAEGETGLIRIFDLANVWSVMAIQTEDLGVREGEGFTLLGRAASAEPRGCSLMAS